MKIKSLDIIPESEITDELVNNCFAVADKFPSSVDEGIFYLTDSAYYDVIMHVNNEVSELDYHFLEEKLEETGNYFGDVRLSSNFRELDDSIDNLDSAIKAIIDAKPVCLQVAYADGRTEKTADVSKTLHDYLDPVYEKLAEELQDSLRETAADKGIKPEPDWDSLPGGIDF